MGKIPLRLAVYTPGRRPLRASFLDSIVVRYIGRYKSPIGVIKFSLVDASLLRDTIDIRFQLGGNPARYSYIPLGNIWIESTLTEYEQVVTMIHEYYETVRMIVGHDTYELADNWATTVETESRNCLRKKIVTNVMETFCDTVELLRAIGLIDA